MKYFREPSVGFLRVASHAKAAENKINFNKNPPKDPLGGIKFGSKPRRRVQDYLVSVSKTNLLVEAAKTKANQVLGMPLTISTRRVKPTSSKATV